jgi:hypothetical protein
LSGLSERAEGAADRAFVIGGRARPVSLFDGFLKHPPSFLVLGIVPHRH